MPEERQHPEEVAYTKKTFEESEERLKEVYEEISSLCRKVGAPGSRREAAVRDLLGAAMYAAGEPVGRMRVRQAAVERALRSLEESGIVHRS
jgi:hypothetical protein